MFTLASLAGRQHRYLERIAAGGPTGLRSCTSASTPIALAVSARVARTLECSCSHYGCFHASGAE